MDHRHLSNIDCLKAHTACLVSFISAVMAAAKKKKEKPPWKTGTCSGHITNLKQSILTFDIYGIDKSNPPQLLKPWTRFSNVSLRFVPS